MKDNEFKTKLEQIVKNIENITEQEVNHFIVEFQDVDRENSAIAQIIEEASSRLYECDHSNANILWHFLEMHPEDDISLGGNESEARMSDGDAVLPPGAWSIPIVQPLQGDNEDFYVGSVRGDIPSGGSWLEHYCRGFSST